MSKTIRNYINIINEIYSNQNTAVLKYFKDKPFDQYQYWFEICEWIFDHRYDEDVEEFLSDNHIHLDEFDSGDDLQEMISEDDFDRMSPELQNRIKEDIVNFMMKHDSPYAPSWSHMNLSNQKLLNRQTWLVHFTDYADEIIKDGFTVGVLDMSQQHRT